MIDEILKWSAAISPFMVALMWFFIIRHQKKMEASQQEKQRVFALEQLVSEKFLDVLSASLGWTRRLLREHTDLETRRYDNPDPFVRAVDDAVSFFDQNSGYLHATLREPIEKFQSIMRFVRNNPFPMARMEGKLNEFRNEGMKAIVLLHQMHQAIVAKYNRFLPDIEDL